jgi:hypothetical protein
MLASESSDKKLAGLKELKERDGEKVCFTAA